MAKLFWTILIVGTLQLGGIAGGGKVGAQAPADSVPTFNKDVAPILFTNCAVCHRPNQVAPMSLRNYKEIRPWARAIRAKIQSGEMPPWYADPRYGEFKNDRRLTPEQVQTVVKWIDGGAPEGGGLHLDERGRANPPGL